jgi:hypothetical protein
MSQSVVYTQTGVLALATYVLDLTWESELQILQLRENWTGGKEPALALRLSARIGGEKVHISNAERAPFTYEMTCESQCEGKPVLFLFLF